VVDPAKGIEHGVILLDETVRNDAFGYATKTQVHRRAKILSSEGRKLADVEVELGWDESIEDWWGSTLLPDGTRLDVKDENVREQTRVREGEWSTRVVKIPLPGVAPGSVIDYGYTVIADSAYRIISVPLQQSWPVLKFRYCWKYPLGVGAAYSVHRSEGLDVHVERDRTSMLLEASNLRPIVREPYMPPAYETQASVSLYYLRSGDSLDDYWNDQAKSIYKANRAPSPEAMIRSVLTAVEQHGGGDLNAKLKTAYEWILANVENRRFVRADASDHTASSAPAPSLGLLFTEVARKLGGEAYPVLAPDRRNNGWDRQIQTIDQLPIQLVAVRSPGAPWDQVVLVDLSCGLPFGELPWWVTGVEGMVATAQGARGIFLPPSTPKVNVSHNLVEQVFSDDSLQVIARWHRISEGQAGLDDAQRLGGASEKNRTARVAQMCSQGSDIEVTRSEAEVGYPPLVVRLDCESQEAVGPDDPETARYEMSWVGPWVEPVPDLLPGPRVHPVVFAFPRVDILELSVKAQAGFRPKDAPEATSFAGPYGKYQLTISATADGFKVQRALALLPVVVPPAEYDALRAFISKVRRADATTLPFARAESPH
jgi:hypothetical protein